MPYTLRCFSVGCMYVYNCYIFLARSFHYYVVSVFVSCNSLYLKCILSDTAVAAVAFIGFPFVWIPFSIPHAFCLYVCLDLKGFPGNYTDFVFVSI